MKKCVKKIPKYNGGTGGVAASVYNAAQKDAPNILNTQASKDFIQTADNVDLTLNQLNPFQTEMNWAEMNNKQKTGSVLGAVGTAVNLASNSIGKEATWQGAASGALQGAAAGMQIGGPWGALIGGVAGAGLASIGTGGDVDMNTGEITMPSGIAGMFGHSKGYLRMKSNLVKNALTSRTLTENLRTDYYNNTPGAGSINVLAAEGGIMRQPVDALVSKGELIYNPVTKKLSQVPGSKGKPNKADDVYAKLYEGDVVISNSPTMLMANGKTPAQNLMGMVDKYATGGTVKAREAIIKKVVNWQEANKTKPQEYAMYDEGTSNVKSADDVSYNNDMYMQMLSMLPMINVLNFGKYNDLQNAYATLGFTDEKPGDNLKKSKAIEDYQKLYEALTLGNERIRAMRNEGRIQGRNGSADKPETWFDGLGGTQTWLRHLGKNLSKEQLAEVNTLLAKQGLEAFHNETGMINYRKLNKPVNAKITPIHPEIEEEIIDELPIPDAEKWAADPQGQYKKGLRKLRLQNLIKPLGKMDGAISGIAPLAAAMVGDYDYHVEQPQISPASRVPLNADPRPLFRAADETYSIGNYNFANLGHSTGAGWAYGSKLAADRAKQYADALKWQQETNNNIIAHNVAIENDWGKRYDLAREKAIENTRANEAAADAQRDTRIKDAMGYYRDSQLIPFLKQYLSSGAYDKSIKRLG